MDVLPNLEHKKTRVQNESITAPTSNALCRVQSEIYANCPPAGEIVKVEKKNISFNSVQRKRLISAEMLTLTDGVGSSFASIGEDVYAG